MSVRRRIEKLVGGNGSRFYLVVEACEGEDKESALSRIARSRGLRPEQVGCALIVWPDDEWDTVDRCGGQPEGLIGWTGHEAALAELK